MNAKLVVVPALILAMTSCVSVPAPGSGSGQPAAPAASATGIPASVASQTAQAVPVTDPEKTELLNGGSGTGTTVTTTPAATVAPTTATSAGSANAAQFMAKARTAMDNNQFAEGIKQYILALAAATKAGDRATASEISGILEEAGARLSMEPHESWLAKDGSQSSGSSRQVSRGDGPMPAVYLYQSYGYAKSPVQDAFIRFEFRSNSGTMTTSVTTDGRGLANTSISSLSQPGREAVVRAYPIFTSGGYSYAFRNVFRDFVYAAPSRVIAVAASETTPAGVQTPRVLEAVSTSMKAAGLEVAPVSGTVTAEKIAAAAGGDVAALGSLPVPVIPGYYAFATISVDAATRLQYQGKVYNIYTAPARASIRILRTDGTVLFAAPADGIKGQGGTEQAAIDDSLVKAREALAELISDQGPAIRKLLDE